MTTDARLSDPQFTTLKAAFDCAPGPVSSRQQPGHCLKLLYRMGYLYALPIHYGSPKEYILNERGRAAYYHQVALRERAKEKVK